MLGDITVLRAGPFGSGPVERFKIASGTTASINAGEPVLKALGAAYVTATGDGDGVVATDFFAGIAQSTSNETAAADGEVDVLKISPGVVYLIAPETAASWDTQAEYDALVGDRVLFNLASGVFTISATDNASNGLIVEPLDIAQYPGKVAFSFRAALNYAA